VTVSAAIKIDSSLFSSRTGYWQWENHSRSSGEPKGTSGGLAISISGCGDSQTSQDTTVSDDMDPTG
jgi:metacaspase-1